MFLNSVACESTDCPGSGLWIELFRMERKSTSKELEWKKESVRIGSPGVTIQSPLIWILLEGGGWFFWPFIVSKMLLPISKRFKMVLSVLCWFSIFYIPSLESIVNYIYSGLYFLTWKTIKRVQFQSVVVINFSVRSLLEKKARPKCVDQFPVGP